ncbi:MAG: hypothetical protein LBK61_11790 [Spirochaetaceae bacterium]|jgi:hypothetical protein|nr:hypothetical protein [Spirochaetaceae bacterium]
MDERTKSILAIEQKMAGETVRIEGWLRELGRLLLERSRDSSIASTQTAYDRINDDIARLEEAVRQIDRDTERMNEIDNKIVDEERLNGEVRRQLTAISPNLGKLITEDEYFSTFSAPYRTQLDAIQQKIDSLNGRLTGLDEKGNANVFEWLGRSAQGLVAKSALAKAEASRERVYAEAGAEFIRDQPTDVQTGSTELDALFTVAGALKHEYDERDVQVAALKKEKQEIISSFGRDGNANRKRAEIRHQMEQLNRELGDLCLRLGKQVEDPSARPAFEGLLDSEMTRILEDVARCREMVKDYEDQTVRLKVSLEIDEERAEVERLSKLNAVQRQRIAAAEEIIIQQDKRIAEANKRIADLLRG